MLYNVGQALLLPPYFTHVPPETLRSEESCPGHTVSEGPGADLPKKAVERTG